MSFKEQLKKDVSCFISSDEFADTHSINGNEVECVLMCADKDSALKYMEGTITSYKSLIVASSLFDSIPQPNDYLNLDDVLFKVSTSSEIGGMTFMDLSKPIGKFDKDITIQEFTKRKVNGFWKEDWYDYHNCKAYIRHMNADDMLKIGTIVNNSTIFVKMPYKESITSKMRLVYKGLVYDITSTDNIEEDNVFIDLICEVST